MSFISKDQIIKQCADAYRTATETTEQIPVGTLPSLIESLSSGVGKDDQLNLLLENKLTEYAVPKGVQAIRQYMFHGCTSLEKVDLSALEGGTIGSNAFALSGVKEVIMPSQLASGVSNTIATACFTETPIETFKYYGTIYCTSAVSRMFSTCTNLTEVDMPYFYFSGTTQMFRYCENLKKVRVKGGSNINANSFQHCANLEALTLLDQTNVATLSGTSVFSQSGIESGTGYIYVPAALIEQYKVATNWSEFATQFRTIEDYPVESGGYYYAA